jgi:hypothetical protein
VDAKPDIADYCIGKRITHHFIRFGVASLILATQRPSLIGECGCMSMPYRSNNPHETILHCPTLRKGYPSLLARHHLNIVVTRSFRKDKYPYLGERASDKLNRVGNTLARGKGSVSTDHRGRRAHESHSTDISVFPFHSQNVQVSRLMANIIL